MHLTEEQQLILDTVRGIVEQSIKPFAKSWEKDKAFPKSILDELGALGLFGMQVPTEYDGADIGPVTSSLVIEEIARGDAALSTLVSVTNSVGSLPILYFGTDRQREQFLKPLARGEKIGCFCLSEPGAGSDAANVKTTAVETDSGFVLNGTKQFITSGKTADIAIVIACTDKSAGKKGLSAFIVPTDTPGYIVSNIEDKMGQIASDTAQITFDNCEIPKDHLIGELGQGYKIALSQLEGGRISIAAQCVGIAQAALQAAISYSKERESFGKSLSKHQAIQFTLAEMATDVAAARALYLSAAELRAAKKPCLKQAAMAKLFASEAAERVTSKALHIHGGYGYLKDYDVERYYRDQKVCQIYEGTNEVQKMVIARDLLA